MLTGLRGRTAAALALVSVITLGIVGLALLAPLEAQLRADVIDTLAQAGRDARTTVATVPAGAFVAGDARLGSALRAVRRQSRGDVVLVDGAGGILATTDPDGNERFPDAVAAARTGQASRGAVGVGDESEARVAVAVVVGTRRYGLALRKPLTEARKAAAVVRREFEVAAAVSLAVALLLGFMLSAGLTRRLGDLRDTALRIADVGPVVAVQPDKSRNEVGDLTRAFAEMQGRLREQEQSQRSFVATASHELRTPLASLLLMLDLLRGDLRADPAELPDARLQAERAEAQALRLSALSAELLDLSRIDASAPLRPELVELGAVVGSVAAEFATGADTAGVQIEIDAAPSLRALADTDSVAQILRILVDNGLRHAPPGTALRLTAAVTDGAATVLVADDGPGVAAADRDRIFERGSSSSASPGFGLGLAIGRELARRMGGDLVTDHERAGGRFLLRLPAACPAGRT